MRLRPIGTLFGLCWGIASIIQTHGLSPRWGIIRPTSVSSRWIQNSVLIQSPRGSRHPPRNVRFWMAADDEDSVPEEEETRIIDVTSENETGEIDPKEVSRLQRIRRRLFPSKPDDGLTFRQRLAKAGLSVALSYGWVSNVSYCVTVSLAWYIFSKRSGLSPLAPGQWKSFLAVYAGFYVFNNIIRPVRFAIAASISLSFDRAVQFVQDKFHVKRGVAIGLTVFLANVVGTIALMCLGISIAATAAGVPVFPAKS